MRCRLISGGIGYRQILEVGDWRLEVGSFQHLTSTIQYPARLPGLLDEPERSKECEFRGSQSEGMEFIRSVLLAHDPGVELVNQAELG